MGMQKTLEDRCTKGNEPVMVRMGLHAGQVIKEGEDSPKGLSGEHEIWAVDWND